MNSQRIELANKYRQLFREFTQDLSSKVKYVLERRFGVKSGEPETLEAIGKTMGITRERVRQIEEVGFNFIRKHHQKGLEKALAELEDYFNEWGGARREDRILEEIGGKKAKPYVLFLLKIGEQFKKMPEREDYYSFWSNLSDPKTEIKKRLNCLVSKLKEINKPVTKEDFIALIKKSLGFPEKAIFSSFEISKKIVINPDGMIGLREWPEIRPRGVREKALLVLKKAGKPLHFLEVAKLVDKLNLNLNSKRNHPQTVHNELIKDSRFVLVGRGIYALAEWGYQPGTIKELIIKILNERKKPLSKDELVKEVLSQRLVSKNTILINLNDKNYFQKDKENRYFLKRKVQVI